MRKAICLLSCLLTITTATFTIENQLNKIKEHINQRDSHPIKSTKISFNLALETEMEFDHDLLGLEWVTSSDKIKTDSPIFGILTQPYASVKEKASVGSDKLGGYIPTAHVRFLEAAGARVVPINYRMKSSDINKLLV